MRIRCAGCSRTITIPAERAGNPRLKVKCTCGAVFALSEAARVEDPPAAAAPVLIELEEVAAAAIAMGPPAAVPRAPTRASAPPPPRPARPAPAPRPLPEAATDWRLCKSHPDRTADYVCPTCLVGLCGACVQQVRGAAICTTCDSLCTPASKHEAALDSERQRARSLFAEIPTILAYPFQDPIAYAMLALFTWVFAVATRFSFLGGMGVGILLSQGVLMAYCFYALSRVSNGNMIGFMPDLSDVAELWRPLRLGAAALLVSAAPLLLVLFLGPGLALASQLFVSAPVPELAVAHAQEFPQAPVVVSPPEAPLSAGLLLLIGLGVLWKLAYTPVALTVAAMSRSVMSTLNPLIGISTISSMGGTYWQAMGIYTVIAVFQGVTAYFVGWIPVVGSLVAAFVNAYAYLTIGCTLGLAVFKKSRELGFD